MHVFILFSILITVAALFSYINFRFFKLPSGISLMLMGVVTSVLMIAGGTISAPFTNLIKAELLHFDFSEFVLGILLSFLLFAGSLHVNYQEMKSSAVSILSFASVSTIVSTFLIGGVAYFVLGRFGFEVPLLACLLFGALVSPTDPIAVIGILKSAGLSKSIEIKITGESLLNDGIGVVIFATILQVVYLGADALSFTSVLKLFLQEAVGGVLLGCTIGYTGFLLMRSIDDFNTEILISLAMVMGGYSLCHYLHVSGPLAMVFAGLITGNKGLEKAMSDITRDYMIKFWQVLDEILNAILFMLIGLEIIIVSFQLNYIFIGLMITVLLILVRYVSLWIPAKLFRFKSSLEDHTLDIMTWGGLRGGISVALALSLPNEPYKGILVSITFVIVIFSVLVQGTTIGKLIKRIAANKPQTGNAGPPTGHHH